MHFEVLRKSQPRSLTRLHGVRRRALATTLSLLVQRYDVAEVDGGGEHTLVPAGDPHACSALEIGSWSHVRCRLRLWKSEPATVAGALAISDAVVCAPRMELTDATCPTFTVLDALRGLGWAHGSKKVTHTVAGHEGKRFCSFSMETRKPYFREGHKRGRAIGPAAGLLHRVVTRLRGAAVFGS